MMCHVRDDIQGQRCATSRTTYNDNVNDMLRQRRHTTAVCHVNEAHNDDDDGPDDAFASSGPLGKFIYLFIYKTNSKSLLQVTTGLTNDARRRRAMSRTTYKDNDMLCQGRHATTTTTTCYINDDTQRWHAMSMRHTTMTMMAQTMHLHHLGHR